MSSKPNFAKIKNQGAKNNSITPLKNQIKISNKQLKTKRETGLQSKKPHNAPEQKKKMDIKKFTKKFSAKTSRRGSDDSKKMKKAINLTENERNELKKEIKEEIEDSILKGVKNAEMNIISSLNNGFSFLGSLFGKSYEEFLKNKDKGINEGNSINSFDIIYNNQNAGSSKISHNNSDNSRKGISKDSMELTSNKNSDNPGKGSSSSESKNEKVIPYGQGNLITSNNAYSANDTININLRGTNKK